MEITSVSFVPPFLSKFPLDFRYPFIMFLNDNCSFPVDLAGTKNDDETNENKAGLLKLRNMSIRVNCHAVQVKPCVFSLKGDCVCKGQHIRS